MTVLQQLAVLLMLLGTAAVQRHRHVRAMYKGNQLLSTAKEEN
jgi:hypothetical protein